MIKNVNINEPELKKEGYIVEHEEETITIRGLKNEVLVIIVSFKEKDEENEKQQKIWVITDTEFELCDEVTDIIANKGEVKISFQDGSTLGHIIATDKNHKDQ